MDTITFLKRLTKYRVVKITASIWNENMQGHLTAFIFCPEKNSFGRANREEKCELPGCGNV